MNTSSTGNLVVNESDDIPSQSPSSVFAHGNSTVSKTVVYNETKIINLMSFDQTLESDDSEFGSVSSGKWCFVVIDLNMAVLIFADDTKHFYFQSDVKKELTYRPKLLGKILSLHSIY